MVIAAVMASLALGVLVAYGLCQMMFHMFRLHSTSVAKERAGAPEMQAAAKG
jgi:hypothetical protein